MGGEIRGIRAPISSKTPKTTWKSEGGGGGVWHKQFDYVDPQLLSYVVVE